MRTDRRGFLRMLGSALALLSGGGRAAGPPREAPGIHAATCNFLLGPAGALRPKRPLPSFKPYPGAERIALPPVTKEPGLPLAEVVRRYAPADGFGGAPISVAELGRLLHFTNGVTEVSPAGETTLDLRAAPSAGALYAGEVYVAAERVVGVGPGLYYYAVANHELVQLGPSSFAEQIGRALERPGVFENAAAVLLLTNVFGRYTGRYANRGYRYALIDSGHIGENLRLAAASAGLKEASALRFFDDALNALVGIDGREEAVCALHAVGSPGSSDVNASGERRRFLEKQRAAPRTLPETEHLTERYHEATKLVPAGANAGRPVSAPPTSPSSGFAVAVGGGPSPLTSVEESIEKRRSPDLFREEPIAFEELGFVLDMAHGHAALARAPGVDLYVAAHRVKDLASGLYRFEPHPSRLAPVRRGDLTGPMIRACGGQEKAGQAAAGFLMVGRLAAADLPLGDRSYRDLLVEAGAIGERTYLAAEAAGLAARNLAAFTDEQINELVGLDGRREAVIHLTMLGHGG